MTLPLERFLMLIDIVQERNQEQAREDLTQAAFITWLMMQHEYSAAFLHAGFSVEKEKATKFRQHQQEFFKELPSFRDYARDLGIIEDD